MSLCPSMSSCPYATVLLNVPRSPHHCAPPCPHISMPIHVTMPLCHCVLPWPHITVPPPCPHVPMSPRHCAPPCPTLSAQLSPVPAAGRVPSIPTLSPPVPPLSKSPFWGHCAPPPHPSRRFWGRLHPTEGAAVTPPGLSLGDSAVPSTGVVGRGAPHRSPIVSSCPKSKFIPDDLMSGFRWQRDSSGASASLNPSRPHHT